jgi:hypothetical protein
MNAVTFGPSGSDSSASAYSRALFHDLCSPTMRTTCSGGIASTRPNRSAASFAPTCTVDSEHDPITIVVTPCRRDSDSDGAASTSAS